MKTVSRNITLGIWVLGCTSIPTVALAQARTPLHNARKAEEAEKLIREGTDVNARDKEGSTPLHRAVLYSREAVVRVLLSRGANAKATNRYGATPLHEAARKDRRLGIVEMLIKKGADVNAKRSNGDTPLHRAAGGGALKIVKFLVAKGAEVDPKRKQDGSTPMQLAAWEGKLDVVAYLVGKGADVNSLTDSGENALFGCVRWGRGEVVKLLIDKGANTTMKNKKGMTPLDVAREKEAKGEKRDGIIAALEAAAKAK